MTIQLTPPSIATVKAVVGFSKRFGADLIKLTAANTAAIDDTPTAFIMFDGISYAGPDIYITRIRALAQRLASDDFSLTVVTGGTEDKPKSLQIKSGKSVIDFRLATERAGDRFPSKFTGSFVRELEIERDDLTTAVAGANAINAKLLTFSSDGKHLTLSATSETETYTASLTDVPAPATFQYNYTVDYLNEIDKMIPKGINIITFSVTAKGHMRIQLPTELKQVTASVFLLDVKNR